MNLKAMATVSLAGLAVAAGGCGDLTNPPVATSVRYASDGTLVVFAGSAIDAYGPDLAQKKVHIPIVSCSEPLFSLSDDGTVAAVACSVSGNRVQLFNLSSGRGTGVIDLGQSSGSASPQDVTLSPTGDLLYVTGGVGGDCCTNGMFDTSTGARLWTSNGFGVRAPFFSPDESTLYVLGGGAEYGGGLQGIGSRTGTIGLDVAVANSVQGFGGMPDPNTLIGVAISVNPVSYAESTEIELLSTADGSVTGQVSLPANSEFVGNLPGNPSVFHCAPAAGVCVLPVVESDPNTHLITANAVQVWALDGTLVQSLDVPVGDTDISPDGQYVAVVVDGDVAVYRVSDGSQVKVLPYRNQIL